MTENKLLFYQSPPPIWKVIAAAGITGTIYFIYSFIINIINETPSILPIFFGLMVFIFTAPLATSTNFHLDLENDRFKEEKQLGLIKIGWWEPLFDFEYISVFGLSENVFVLRLWFDTNQYFTVSGFDQKAIALEQAMDVAKTMKIDLWDATDPRNGFWVERDEK